MCKRRLINILIALAVAATAQACRTKSRPFEVAFWAGTAAERDPRVVSVREHGLCTGNIAIARVTHMPLSKDVGALKPELAVELSPSGVILRRWSLPVDGIVVAVSDDQLIVPRGDTEPGAEALSISSSGDLYLTKVPEKTDRDRPS